jgi:tetratricopeptide (TPR) repeat protein
VHPFRFEVFTEPAQRSLGLAQAEAEGYRHGQIDTEHILLGLLGVEDGSAARMLREQGIHMGQARSAIESRITPSQSPQGGGLSAAPRVRKVIETAFGEARGLGLTRVPTGALLLGLLQTDGIAAEVLASFGVAVEPVRARIASGPPEMVFSRTPVRSAGRTLAKTLLSLAESLRRGNRLRAAEVVYSWSALAFGAARIWHDAGVCLINRSRLQIERGDYASAARSLEQAEQSALRAGSSNLMGACAMERGHMHVARGDIASAKTVFAERLVLEEANDAPARVANLNYNLAWVDFLAGAFDQAEARIGGAWAGAPPVQPEFLGLLRMLSGRLLMRRGELVAAAAQFDLAAAAFGEEGSLRGLAMVDFERSMLAFRKGAGVDIEACRRAIVALTDRGWRDPLMRRLFSLSAVAVERADAAAPALLALLKRPVEGLARPYLSATLAALRKGDGSALAAARDGLQAESGSGTSGANTE